MGAGGLGGYLGARLAQAGCDVTFIARGAHLAAMRSSGLRVESPQGDQSMAVQATDDPSSVGPVDYVFFCVKLWDSTPAAAHMRPLVGPTTTVISFQNGVRKDDLLRREFGDGAVMGGVAYIAAAVSEPGTIVQTGAIQRLIFGELDGTTLPRGEALLEACRAAGIDAELHPDVTRAIWEKFVFLVGLSGATTSTRASIGPIRENPRSREFLLDLMREVVAIGRARGVDLPPDYADQRLAFVDTLPPEMTSSMHHDLTHGHRLEVDELSGAVATMGTELGIATPANRAVAAILAPWANGSG